MSASTDVTVSPHNYQDIKADADEFDPVLPDQYESPLALPDQFDGLFDSRRDYLTQLSAYKSRGGLGS